MKKLLLVVALFATVALGIYALAQGPSEYNRRTTAEYRQMIGEGK